MTQAELGALAECSDLFVRELEKGKPTVRLETVLRVMNAIGLTLNVGDVK